MQVFRDRLTKSGEGTGAGVEVHEIGAGERLTGVGVATVV